MDLQLGYGSGHITLRVPRANVASLVRPGADAPAMSKAAVTVAIRGSTEWERFLEAVRDKRLCVLLPDGTRDLPMEAILPDVLTDLNACREVSCVVCTGTHDSRAAANVQQGERIAGLLTTVRCAGRTCVHDCRRAQWIDAGRTAWGTPVIYNAVIESAEVFLVLSDVKPHYFAGYSNPVKNFVPGVCHFDTAERNHSLAIDDRSTFGRHPWHPSERRRDNPLAADMVEGMERVIHGRPIWAVVTLSDHRGVQWVRFDSVRPACEAAFVEADRRNGFYLAPTRHLIVSPGGLPNDVDLYIAQRALELTQAAVCDGGEILFVSACPEGVGEAHTRAEFYDRLTWPLEEVLDFDPESYRLFSHKPVKFARMIRRLHRLWVRSEIPADLLSAAHLDPAPDAQAVVDHWLTEEPGARIHVIDGANKVAVYAADRTADGVDAFSRPL